jgi:hypothetical protein
MGFLDIFKISQFKSEIEQLKQQNNSLQQKLDSLCFNDYNAAQNEINRLNAEAERKKIEISDIESQRNSLETKLFEETKATNEQFEEFKTNVNNKISALNEEIAKADKKLKTSTNKLAKSKEIYKSIEYSINNFFEYDPDLERLKLSENNLNCLEELSPSVTLKLHYMDVKSLRKAFRDNDKQIEKVLSQYQARYTTKANRSIYDLMVIALRAELQNVLYNLKFEKLDKGIEQVKEITQKYLDVAAKGNQSIAGTLTKFIGEIEYLFINAVKIEYNYYVKKEQARQEQYAIREQMKQEAEERKALEQEKKQIEKEESKYNSEIEKLNNQLKNSSNEEQEILKTKILELQAKLADVTIKKDSISKLQNGKAGNVYVISNLGSFGENVFKVGMTRRLDPQERINELGNASVPFKFDVHSFIFSEDAVSLENKLHSILSNKRVNKVNPRKEFFYTTVDELETLVNDIDPTAEFNKTMLAEEFRQSQSSTENYTSDYTEYDEEDED